jgi:hypothetical protein
VDECCVGYAWLARDLEYGEVAISVTADGRVIVTWLQSRTEAVLATARLSGGPFERPQPLRTGGGGVADRITSLKQVSNTVAWSTKTQTWIADVRADGRLGPRQTRAGELGE